MQRPEEHPFLTPMLVLLYFHTNRRLILHSDAKYTSHDKPGGREADDPLDIPDSVGYEYYWPINTGIPLADGCDAASLATAKMLLRSESGLAYARLLMNSPSSLLRSSVLSAPGCSFFIGATAPAYRTLGNQLDLKDGVPKVARCDAQDCREKPPLRIFQFYLKPVFR